MIGLTQESTAQDRSFYDIPGTTQRGRAVHGPFGVRIRWGEGLNANRRDVRVSRSGVRATRAVVTWPAFFQQLPGIIDSVGNLPLTALFSADSVPGGALEASSDDAELQNDQGPCISPQTLTNIDNHLNDIKKMNEQIRLALDGSGN